MLGIGLVMGAITAVVAVFIPWMPDAASEEAGRIDRVYWLATIICIAIFALVAGVSVYAVWRFRAPPDDEEDGAPIHGHTGLEVVWTAVPTALVTAITVYSGVVLVQIEDAPPGTRVVHVDAAQFAWSFRYDGEDMPASGELVLPVDQPVRLLMTSNDVIHSFWVPEWRMKQDVVPGIETKLLITPTKLGTYEVICTELCGLGHGTMRARARVVPPEEFDQWLAERAAAAAGGGPEQGAEIFAQNCGSCHTLAAAGTTGQVGPDLDASLAGKDAAYVRESILDPNAVIADGYQPDVMPQNYGELLSDQQVDGLVEYLVSATSEEG
jgi:cytochrome c oxidase subunit 2